MSLETMADRKAQAAKDRDVFVSMYPHIVEQLMKDAQTLYPDYDKDALAYYRRCLDYTVPGGKMNRGLSVLTSYRHLIGDREPTPQEVTEANILGWTVELLQAFFLVADDIMDQSITRRGQPCWYQLPDVGMVAINDSFLIQAAVYKLLKHYFREKPYYVDLLELMNETTYQTELGQLLDLITAPQHTVDLNRFSIEKHTTIVKYKTAFYSFYLPVAMAMLMAGVKDEMAYNHAQAILVEMGIFFQIQDDYLDCYGDPEVIGKIGTDIQDNKCGWLVVQALARATPAQRQVLEENYAKKDPACEAKVKQLYEEMNLKALYMHAEEESYQRLMQLIETKAGSLPKGIFTDFAAKIYKRSK